MKLYKYIPFKSCSKTDCSTFSKLNSNLFESFFTNLKVTSTNDLNDPFEGFFSAVDSRKKVGCLSLTPPANDINSIYMWSHYGNALKGN